MCGDYGYISDSRFTKFCMRLNARAVYKQAHNLFMQRSSWHEGDNYINHAARVPELIIDEVELTK